MNGVFETRGHFQLRNYKIFKLSAVEKERPLKLTQFTSYLYCYRSNERGIKVL